MQKVKFVLMAMLLIAIGFGLTWGQESPYISYNTETKLVNTLEFKKNPPWKIGFSNASVLNSWRVCMVAHVRQEVARHPEIEEFYYTDAEGDAAKQLSDVEDLLAKDIDLLILSPVTEALAPAANKAMEQGVPVVYLDRRTPSPNFVTYVTSSNYKMGKMMAEWLVEKLDGKGDIVLLSGVAGASPAEDRLKGARDVFSQYPEINELAQAYTGWSPTEGKKIMATYIQRFGGEIDGVWNDSALQGGGAIEAFVDAGMDIPPITGEDMNRYFKQWKEYDFNGVAVSFPVWQGTVAVQKSIDILNGISVPRVTDVPRTVITKEMVDEYVRPDLPDGFFVDSRLTEEFNPFK